MKTLIFTMILTFTVSYAQGSEQVDMVQGQIERLTKKKSPLFKGYAKSIVKYSNKYQIDPMIVVSIIMTESSFKPNKISKTGDLGLVQINPTNWVPEFKRIFNETLDLTRLMNDTDYSIHKMTQILSYHKDSSDPYWFGKYHSKTPSLKMTYYKRVVQKFDTSLRTIAMENNYLGE